MKILVDNSLLNNLNVDNFRIYLEQHGWILVNHSNTRLFVFEGPLDDNGEPITLAIPNQLKYRDAYDRLTDAVNILADIEQTSPEDVIQKIRFIDRDILQMKIRLPANAHPSLEKTFQIAQGIKNLVLFSACMEVRPKAYYVGRRPNIGKQQTQYFRFGHTFSGSFGFTIESPHLVMQQLPFSSETIIPTSRRVIERIVRGLVSVEKADKNRSSIIISQTLTTGLNGNMCQALLEITSGIESDGVEYTITWSPQLQPSRDIAEIKTIQLSSSAFHYVEEALKHLKVEDSEKLLVVQKDAFQISEPGPNVTIRGKISNIKSINRNMLIATIHWDEVQRVVDVVVGPESYRLACDAFRDFRTVYVTGWLNRDNSENWTLVNPDFFKVE
jgi:hypothetical protein